MANEYKDKKGHYTTEENNGKECIHSGSSQAEVERYADMSANELADKLKQEVEKKPFINMYLFSNIGLKQQGKIQLEKGIRSLNQKINEHEQKIKNPKEIWGEKWDSFSDERKKREIQHWEKEIKQFKAEIEYRIEELSRRKENEK